MGRSPGDGDRFVALHLVEGEIDASDNICFCCNQFNGVDRKQFDAIETIRDKVVAR